MTGALLSADRVVEGLVGDVGDIHQHAKTVHLEDDLLAAIGQAVVMLDLWIVDVAGRVGPFVRIRPAQGHVANAEAIEITQQVNVIFDGVSTLNAKQRGELVLTVSPLDICHAESHHHAIGMAGRLLVNGIDQIERVSGEVSLICLGIDPDRKEFRAKIACLRLVETDMSDIFRIGGTDVIVLV